MTPFASIAPNREGQTETFYVLDDYGRWENLGTWILPKDLWHFAHKAFICPRCGVVWAKSILSGVDRFLPELERCEQHGDGTLLFSAFDPRIEYLGLPEPLLEREVFLTFKNKEIPNA